MRVMRPTTRRAALRTLSGAALVGALGATAACNGGDEDQALWSATKPVPKIPKAVASVVSPAANASQVPASAEIEFATENAISATCELKDAAGKVIGGTVRPDTKIWVPETMLTYGGTYTVTVTATGADNKTTTATSTFTVMGKPGNTVTVSTNIGDNMVAGVGMPMVLRFGRAVPKQLRADIQKRLWVTSTPAQEGTWHWFNDSEVHYRPKTYWQGGTKLAFRIGIGGLPMGGNWFGRADVTVHASIRPDSLIMSVDNATKKMTVTQNGQVIKTMPVSLGKRSTPSSSGTMVVMERLRTTTFNTMNDPDPANRYITDIEYAQRLTWGGEFIHAASWSEGDQGRRNVSHGCVNVSVANAAWLFNLTKVGDPVTVKGTERTLDKGNGWTDWSMSWDQYVKGSAIPYTPPAPPPSPSTNPSTNPSTAPSTSPSGGA